jgi:excisionase family DNA binding protein
MDGRLLDVPQVAQMLGVSQWLCWQLVWTGELRSVRVGRFVRIRPADVDSYLETADADRYLEKSRRRAATLAATRAMRRATRT